MGVGVDPPRSPTGPHVVHDGDGAALDARFRVEEIDGAVSVIIEARGGTTGTEQAVNTQYAPGLDLILTRLQMLEAVITSVRLDTARTVNQSADERELHLRGDRQYPIRLVSEDDLPALRRALSAAQGNNPTRRIRIEITLPEQIEPRDLVARLARTPTVERE